MRIMKHSKRQRILAFIFIAFVAGLFFVSHQWQEIHYRKPLVAFNNLAHAMEQGNETALERLAPKGIAPELHKIAKPYGGIQPLGTLLKQSPQVSTFIHVPLTSMEVVAKVKHKHLTFLFWRRQDRYVVTTVFSTE